jgi:transcriptional regulatory protein RtcR
MDPGAGDTLRRVVSDERLAELDEFDRVQLEHVVEVSRQCRSLSEAGRMLFSASRGRKSTTNDADRLRKYLARFGLEWSALIAPEGR